MSGKEGTGAGNAPPTSKADLSPGAGGPVDLATRSVQHLAPIRIPSVPVASVSRHGAVANTVPLRPQLAPGPAAAAAVAAVPVRPLLAPNAIASGHSFSARPTLITPQVSVIPAPPRTMGSVTTIAAPLAAKVPTTGAAAVHLPSGSLSISNITMLPSKAGGPPPLSQIRPNTRPVLAAAASPATRMTTAPPRSAVATPPMLRGVATTAQPAVALLTQQQQPTVQSTTVAFPVTLRSPAPGTNISTSSIGAGSAVRLQIPVSQQQQQQQLQTSPQWTAQTLQVSTGAVRAPRPSPPSLAAATLLPVSSRAVTMAALNFRPPPMATAVTSSRPHLGGGGVVGTSASVSGPINSKSIGTVGGPPPVLGLKAVVPISSVAGGVLQSSPQMTASHVVAVGAAVALKPPPSSAASTSTLPRLSASTVVATSSAAAAAVGKLISPTTPAAVSLTPAAHIQVPMVPTGPKPRVQRMVQISTPRTITLPYSGQQAKAGVPPVGTAGSSTSGIPIARVTPQPSMSTTANPQQQAGFLFLPVGATTAATVGGQQQLSTAGGQQLAGAGSQPGGPPPAHQTVPVNLTVTDRTAARPPAMTVPSFTSPTFLYETTASSSSRPIGDNSVTITTLQQDAHQPQSQIPLGPGTVTITPARITPLLQQQPHHQPPQQQQQHHMHQQHHQQQQQQLTPQPEQDKQVPGSPRPSILRKRDCEGTPVKGSSSSAHPAPAASPPPARPDSSSGSSTVSAPSSAAFSGDEQNPTTQQQQQQPQHAPPPAVAAAAQLEPSPRKKPRKQQLPPPSSLSISPEWVQVKRELGVRDRLEWEGGRLVPSGAEPGWEGRVHSWNNSRWGGGGSGGGGHTTAAGGQLPPPTTGWVDGKETDQADDEEEMTTDDEVDKGGNFWKGKPRMILRDSKPWKSRHNHFLRFSDVKPKDDRRPTVNELANQKYVYQKINGWKIYHLAAGMDDIVHMESELTKKLQDISKRLEETSNEDITLVKVQELLKANIQRSKVIQDQVREAKQNMEAVFQHKSKMQNIISKYHNKRAQKRTF